MRKQKLLLIAAVCALAIGFAAVSTTLFINGDVGVTTNVGDYKVFFSAAVIDDVNVSSTAIIDGGSTIKFDTKTLSSIGDTSVLDFEVTNASTNYGVLVDVQAVTGQDADQVGDDKTVSVVTEFESGVLNPRGRRAGKVTVTLNQFKDVETTLKIDIKLVASAVETITPNTGPLNSAENVIYTNADYPGLDTVKKALDYVYESVNGVEHTVDPTGGQAGSGSSGGE